MVNVNSKAKLLIYDGDCGLCHWAVGFLIKRLNKEKSSLYFISSTSELGDFLLRNNNFDPHNLDSLVLCHHEDVLLRSDAVKCALQECRAMWPFVGKLVGILPGRNWFYNKIAQNRQKFMSKDKCIFDPNFARFSLNKITDLESL